MTPRSPRGAAIAAALATAVLASSCSFEATRESPTPIPPGIPPAAGAPVPTVDLAAPGRTSEQLFEWAQGLNEQMNIPYAALAAYGNAAETIDRKSTRLNSSHVSISY